MLMTYASLVWTFVLAHWQAILGGLFLGATILNRLLPGHPYLSGIARQAIALLAGTPMAGARSAFFLFLASKFGDTLAGDICDWLSTWLDIPIVSWSKVTPGGLTELRPKGFAKVPVLMLLLAAAFGCALFGPTFKQDEIDCGKAALHEAQDKLLPVVALILADPNVAFAEALSAIEATAGDALLCAVAVAVRDFENHSPEPLDAGQTGASGEATTASLYSIDLAVARGHQYLATHKTPVLPGN